MQVLPWPPPSAASGNCYGVRDGAMTPVLHQFHYTDERGSQWGFVVESYRTHGRQVEDTGHFDGWVWLGPGIPTAEAQAAAFLLWAWDSAPGELRALSEHGGDEDVVCLCPPSCASHEDIPWWVERVHWDDRPSTGNLPDGRLVIIWAHA